MHAYTSSFQCIQHAVVIKYTVATINVMTHFREDNKMPLLATC